MSAVNTIYYYNYNKIYYSCQLKFGNKQTESDFLRKKNTDQTVVCKNKKSMCRTKKGDNKMIVKTNL